MEIWKDIKGFEGYMVSNLGRVKSLPRYIDCGKYKQFFKGCMFKQHKWNNYFRVPLSKNNIPFQFYVHRLIAEAFIPNPNNKKCINHKDGDKTNNNVSNLEWVTHLENLKHAVDTGLNSCAVLQGEEHGCARLCNEQVLKIRALAEYLKIFELAKIYKMSYTAMRYIILRKTWKHI